MKRSVLVAALVSAGCLAIAGSGDAQITRTKYTDYKDIHYPAAFPSQTNVPEIPFDVDPHFFKMPPDLKYGQHIDFGEVSAVTDNAAGHIFVLNRNDVKGGVYGSMATQIWSSTKRAITSANTATTSTASPMVTASASTPRLATSGWSTRAPTW